MNALQYQILTEKGIDKEVIQVLEEAFQSKDKSTATKGDLEIVKLTLQKEIEEVRLTLQKEIEEVRLTLQKEIKEVELRILKEIRRSDIKMFWLLLGFLSPMYLGILSVALKVFFF